MHRPASTLLMMTVLVMATSCAVRNAPPVSASLPPQAYFDALEQRLLDAETLRVNFHITSEGAVESDLTGFMELPGNGVANLSADGIIAAGAATITLVADGMMMTGGSNDKTFSSEQPPHLREALIFGLTRMGLLHSLAVMSGGVPPDRADGGVREWVQVRDVAVDALGVAPVGFEVLTFDIHVGGNRAADASLLIDLTSGLPVRRRQTVNFPGGSMEVVEEYEFVVPNE